jgi:Histidine kinase-, DNA gyrase B-, and HSP90-like ATPase
LSDLSAMLSVVERIHLEAADDHVQVLAHEGDPVRAVVELIWNCLDADAHRVTVQLRRNDLDGVDGVTVTDEPRHEPRGGSHCLPVDRWVLEEDCATQPSRRPAVTREVRSGAFARVRPGHQPAVGDDRR